MVFDEAGRSNAGEQESFEGCEAFICGRVGAHMDNVGHPNSQRQRLPLGRLTYAN
jgi:hypothetical protein